MTLVVTITLHVLLTQGRSYFSDITPTFLYFSDILGYPNGAIGAAGVTVIVIHIIVGFYIWVAIQEEKEPAPIKQD